MVFANLAGRKNAHGCVVRPMGRFNMLQSRSEGGIGVESRMAAMMHSRAKTGQSETGPTSAEHRTNSSRQRSCHKDGLLVQQIRLRAANATPTQFATLQQPAASRLIFSCPYQPAPRSNQHPATRSLHTVLSFASTPSATSISENGVGWAPPMGSRSATLPHRREMSASAVRESWNQAEAVRAGTRHTTPLKFLNRHRLCARCSHLSCAEKGGLTMASQPDQASASPSPPSSSRMRRFATTGLSRCAQGSRSTSPKAA